MRFHPRCWWKFSSAASRYCKRSTSSLSIGRGKKGRPGRSARSRSCRAARLGLARHCKDRVSRVDGSFGSALIGSEVEFWYDQFLAKPPRDGAPTYWHQDEGLLGTQSLRSRHHLLDAASGC